MRLIYRGYNNAHIPHVPARDLDDTDIMYYANERRLSVEDFINALTRYGLYELEETIVYDDSEDTDT